jgi:hypothetical protein
MCRLIGSFLRGMLGVGKSMRVTWNDVLIVIIAFGVRGLERGCGKTH